MILSATIGVVTPGLATAAAIKVACVGDNMTHSDQFSNDRENQPPGMQEYPRKLQDLMGSGYDVRNFGDCCASVIGGYASSETHPYVSGSNYKNAVALLPDIVLIGPWGRHDWGKSAMTALAAFSVPAFQTGYEDIINKFQALSSKPKIIVSNLVPLPFGNDGPDGMMNLKTSPQRDVILALAAKYNLQVVDTFTAFSGAAAAPLFIQPPTKDSDGEHTSDMGSTKLAQMFAEALKGTSGSAPGADGGVVASPDAGSGAPSGSGGNSGGGTGGGTGGTAVAAGTGGSSASSSSGGSTPPTATGGAVGTGGASVLTGTGGASIPPVSSGGATSPGGGVATTGTGGALATGPTGTGGAPAAGATSSGSSGCSCGLAGEQGPAAAWGILAATAMLGLALVRSRRR
jgi:hypothetical protein